MPRKEEAGQVRYQDAQTPKTFKVSPGLIAGPTAFLFLREALQPLVEDTMYYWLTDKDNKNGPMLTQEEYGFYDCAGYVGLFLGVCIYNRYMSKWKFRRIFIWAQVNSPRRRGGKKKPCSRVLERMLINKSFIKAGLPRHIQHAGPLFCFAMESRAWDSGYAHRLCGRRGCLHLSALLYDPVLCAGF